MLRPEQERVRQLLTEAVTLLCRNSLHFEEEVTVEGLLGITLDRHDIFLVSIHETIQQALKEVSAPSKGEKRTEVGGDEQQTPQSAKRRKILEHRRDSGSRKSPPPESAKSKDNAHSDRASRKDSVSNIKKEQQSDQEYVEEPSNGEERKFNPAHDSTSTSAEPTVSEPTPESIRQKLDFDTRGNSSQVHDDTSQSQDAMDRGGGGVQVKQEVEEPEEECYLVESDSEEHSDNSHSSSMMQQQQHTWPGAGDAGFNLSELDLLAAQQFSQNPQQFGNLSGAGMPFPVSGEIPVAGPSQSLDGSQRGGQKFLCIKCDKYFATQGSLKEHDRRVHLKLRPFGCTMCDRRFLRKDELRYHMALHQQQGWK